MTERKFSFAGIPLLTLATDSTPRPVVLFYHGLHSTKETHRKELESLATRGFLAVGVDAVGHGERRIEDLSQFLNRGELLAQVTKLLRPSCGGSAAAGRLLHLQSATARLGSPVFRSAEC